MTKAVCKLCDVLPQANDSCKCNGWKNPHPPTATRMDLQQQTANLSEACRSCGHALGMNLFGSLSIRNSPKREFEDQNGSLSSLCWSKIASTEIRFWFGVISYCSLQRYWMELHHAKMGGLFAPSSDLALGIVTLVTMVAHVWLLQRVSFCLQWTFTFKIWSGVLLDMGTLTTLDIVLVRSVHIWFWRRLASTLLIFALKRTCFNC